MTLPGGRLRAARFWFALPCAALLALAAPGPAQAELTETTGSATMVSLSGDYIGEGTDRLYDEPGTLQIGGGLGNVEVLVEEGEEWWVFEFQPPTGGQLEDREYSGAELAGSQSKGLPGLSVSGDDRGCNTVYGWFKVKDIHVDALGHVDRFWALYEQHCEGRESPALFGEVRVGEPATGEPEEVEPTAIHWPNTSVGTLRPHVPVTVIAGPFGAEIASVALEGPDASDFTVTGDECSGESLATGERCELDVSARPAKAGIRTATLVIADASGAETTVPLEILGTSPPPKEPRPEETQTSPPVLVKAKPPSTTTSTAPPPPASLPQPPHVVITPTKRRKPIPDLFVEIGALRRALLAPGTGAVQSYQYVFSARNIHCYHGANKVVLDVAGKQHFAPCKTSLVIIGGAVAPKHYYTVFVEAVIMRKHRIRKLGAAYTRRLYMPGEEVRWVPLTEKPPVI